MEVGDRDGHGRGEAAERERRGNGRGEDGVPCERDGHLARARESASWRALDCNRTETYLRGQLGERVRELSVVSDVKGQHPVLLTPSASVDARGEVEQDRIGDVERLGPVAKEFLTLLCEPVCVELDCIRMRGGVGVSDVLHERRSERRDLRAQVGGGISWGVERVLGAQDRPLESP